MDNKISERVREIKEIWKELTEMNISETTQATLTVGILQEIGKDSRTPERTESMQIKKPSIDEVRTKLGGDASILELSTGNGVVKVAIPPKLSLGKEQWDRIHQSLKVMGGKWNPISRAWVI